MEHDHKSDVKYLTTGFTLKMPDQADGEQGLVEAVFSTFGVVDSEGDIVEAGSVPDGDVPMYWQHGWSQLNIGRGTIRSNQSQALFSGHFYLDTDHGLNAYRTVKQNAEMQEWSWAFRILDASFEQHEDEWIRRITKTEPWEVSPVMRGAGVGTHTTQIKSLTFADEGTRALAALESYCRRAKAIADLRHQEGRDLSGPVIERLSGHAKSFREVADELEALIATAASRRADDAATTFAPEERAAILAGAMRTMRAVRSAH